MNGIDVQGLDELIDLFGDMEITEQKEKKALTSAGELLKTAVQSSAPKLTGYTKKSIKNKITRVDGNLACKINVRAWDAIFSEYGSSKNRKYVGWFSNSIDATTPEAISILKSIILNKGW